MADSILNLILRTVRSGSGAKEAADDLDKVKNKTEETTAATVEGSRAQARLAAAMFDVEDAALKLSAAEAALASNTDASQQRELSRAVADARVEFISAEEKAERFKDELSDVSDKTEETKDALGSMNRGWADVKAGFDLLGQGLGYAKAAFDMTIGKAAAWGDEMGDLAQLTGTSVRETSELAATLELLGIKQDGLNKIVKAFTAQGLQPTMTNIRALAAEYQAIQDPIEKNEFLFKRFGRQAADVAEILGKSTEELDSFTEAARQSGKVIDEETAAAGERLNVQLEKLKQRAEGAGIAIGNFFIPTIVDLFEANDKLTAAVERGDVSWLEYLNRLAQVATGHGTAATLTAGLTEHVERLKDDTVELTTATDIQTRSITALAAETGRWAGLAAQYAADEALKKRLEDLTGAASDLKFGMGELTREVLFNQAAQGLDAEAAYNLAKSMGLINPAADAAKGILDDLRKQYETGAITAGQFQGSVKLLADAIDSLPDGKTITIEYLEKYRKEYEADLGNRGNVNNNRQGGAIGDGSANGLDMIVPPGYPNDTYGPIYAQSGERVQVTPAGQVTNNMGGVTIIVNGAGDPRATAEEVSRVLAQQARGLTQSGIAYMG